MCTSIRAGASHFFAVKASPRVSKYNPNSKGLNNIGRNSENICNNSEGA
jgi:hypothetical protein